MKPQKSRLPIIDAKSLGADCDACPLNGQIPVPPKTSKHPVFAIVTESPSSMDVIHRKPDMGKGGELIKRICELEGISYDNTHSTHAVMCRPKRFMTPTEWKQALKCCRPRLHKELAGVKHVLSLGAKSQETLTGKAKLNDWMGAVSTGLIWKSNGKPWVPLKTKPEPPDDAIRFDNIEIISTVNPGQCVSNPALTPVLRKHVKRLYLRAVGKLPDWKWPEEVVDNDEPVLVAALKLLYACDHVAVDTETTGLDPYTVDLLNVGISNAKISVSLRWQECSILVKSWALKILASNKIKKSFWNMQYDLLVFKYQHIEVNGHCDDWMIAHQIIAPRLSHKLTDASCYEFHVPRWKTVFHKTSDDAGSDRFLKADPTVRALYNARDTYVTFLLAAPFQDYLSKIHRGAELYTNSLHNAHTAMEMRVTGIKLDKDVLAIKRKKLEGRFNAFTRKLRRIVALYGIKNFNPASIPQRKKLFQQTLKVAIPVVKGKRPLDENALLEFAKHHDKGVRIIAKTLLALRKVKKKQDYLKFENPKKGLKFIRQDTFTLHPNWKPGKAKTGRWASGDPNLMNFPQASKGDTEKLREIFIARPGKVFVEVDFAGLEARIIAIIANDKVLLDWFATGVDIHTRTAALALGKKDEEVTKTEREIMKSVRYAYHYNAAPKTAWAAAVTKLPDLSLRLIEKLFAKMKKIHPDIAQYHVDVLKQAEELDYVEDPLSGRRFYFHGQVDANQVYNLPIQMCASKLIDDAMARIKPRLRSDEKILLQVHDSLLLEGIDMVRLITVAREEMERPVTLKGQQISFLTDAKVGTCWARMEKVQYAG